MDILEITDEDELRLWIQTTAQAVGDVREFYEREKVARSAGKCISRALDGKLLGSQLYDGIRARGPGDAIRALLQLTFATVVRPRCTKKWLQILLGWWVRQQQLDTSTAACLSWPASHALSLDMVDELLCCVGLLPR